MQKRNNRHITPILLLSIWLFNTNVFAVESPDENVNPKEVIFEHIQDAYWWHITTVNNHPVSVYLPVIVYSSQSGLAVFSSSHIAHNQKHKGYYITNEGKYAGKIV